MLLSCKYEEVTVPIVNDFILISDKAYTKSEVFDMEKELMNTLEFNLSVPTPFVFMKRFLKAARSYKEMELLCFYLIDPCLVEYEMLKFPPSLLAATAVFTAECTLKGSKQWTKTSEFHSQYSQNHVLQDLLYVNELINATHFSLLSYNYTEPVVTQLTETT
ncbi:putative cyclin domain-containing protein [Helianthus debilis subsp. tardiflorus]